MKNRLLTIFVLFFITTLFCRAQHTCNNINLWVNGTFEDTVLGLTCSQINPINVYYIKTPPWNGVTTFINPANRAVNTAFLDEPDTDHTTGTSAGCYFYCDPRDDNGWTYQLEQTVTVQPNTKYTFSAWFCSMLAVVDSDAPANVRMVINGTVVAGTFIIRHNPNKWIQYSGTWNSGGNDTALLEIDDLNPTINGNDFALYDVYFGAGIFKVNAGRDTSFCLLGSPFHVGGNPTAFYGATCGKYNYKWNWFPASGMSISSDTVANPLATITTPQSYQLIVTVTDLNKNSCLDTVNIAAGVSQVTIIPQSPTVCAGQSIILTVPPSGLSYLWSPATSLSPSTGDTVVASPTIQTTYTVTGSDSLGGTATGSDVVYVSPAPDKPTLSQHDSILTTNATQGIQWSRNDTVIPGATTQNYTITIAGWYKVVVVNPANGCSATSDSMYFSPTGVNQLSISNNQLSIYPNPTGGEIFVTINLSAAEVKDWDLIITDVLGRTVFTKQSLNNSNDIDLSNLSSGMYFISVINKTGRLVLPVVKQ